MATTAVAILAALKSPEESLRTLRKVVIEHNANGTMLAWVGNSVVVVRLLLNGTKTAMRCYMKPHPYLQQIYHSNYLPNELIVGESVVDVVLCDWVEGELLANVVEQELLWCNGQAIAILSHAFDNLALKMLNRHDWAHGDLSLDNIVLSADGSLQLIDNDSNYVAQLSGLPSTDLGTPIFQSPLRTKHHFNSSTDHFSIALISAALKALAIDPSLSQQFPLPDGLLIDAQQLTSPNYKPMERLLHTLAAKGEFIHYRIARLLLLHQLELNTLPTLINLAINPRKQIDSRNITLFESQGVWGYIDQESGEVAITPLFDEAFEFRGTEALVRVLEYWFYIDKGGNIVDNYGRCEKKPPIIRRLQKPAIW